jgi:hypothetical protein
MKYFLPLFLLFVLTSCSVQKRLYNKGLYTSKNQTIKKQETQHTTKQVSLLSTIKQIKKETNTPLLATTVKVIEIINKKQTLLIDPCDTIVMKTGERLLGKVTKVTEDKVFFENCDPQSYSSSSIHKADIGRISYANVKQKTQIDNGKKSTFFIAKLIVFLLLILCLMTILFVRNSSSSFGLVVYLFFASIFLLIALAIMLLITLILWITN